MRGATRSEAGRSPLGDVSSPLWGAIDIPEPAASAAHAEAAFFCPGRQLHEAAQALYQVFWQSQG